MFDTPSGPTVRSKFLTQFLGVDYTSILPDQTRATVMTNLINNNGYLETRPGYAQIGVTVEVNTHDPYVALTTYSASSIVSYNGSDYTCILESTNNIPTNTTYWTLLNANEEMTSLPINGVWNIDKPDDSFIVHAGTNLYKIDNTFTTKTLLKTGLANKITKAFYISDYFILLDGVRALVYGYFTSAYQIKEIDTIGYTPTIYINSNPDGTSAIVNEVINLIQPLRVSSFLGNTIDTVYHLQETLIDAGYTPTVSKLNSSGVWVNATITSFDATAGTVTLTAPSGASPVDGQDNIKITYKKTNNETIGYINGCWLGELYGYNANKDRLFIAGNSTYPNVVWYSASEDPLYFPADNYIKVGIEPITNFLVLNDGKLSIQKAVSDSDFTIYYLKSVILNNKEGFSIDSGSKNIGCISSFANANLLNDTITLSSNGLYGIVSSSQGERFANERSYYIKKKLLEEVDLENGYGIVNTDKYYLLINDQIYVADSRYKTKNTTSSGSYGFQYEWYYWDNIPGRILFTYNEQLYFGTEDGKIVKFNDTCLDYTTPIICRFETAFLNFGSIVNAKTIKQITVISRPEVDSQFTLGYITDEGEQAVITKHYSSIDYPRTLCEGEKISNFMYIKFYLENNTSSKLSFAQMGFSYVINGKYRGE